MKVLRHSLVARIVAFLLVISGISMASIGLTMVIAESSRGDATAINLAGSLRWNASQIKEALSDPANTPSQVLEQQVNSLSDLLSNRLQNLNASHKDGYSHNETVMGELNQLNRDWHEHHRPALENALEGRPSVIVAAHLRLDDFIADIDRFVSLLEASTEAKLHLLSTMQILFLALIGLLLLIAFFDIRHNLITPLRQLMVLSREAGRRNFHYRTHFRSHDELGQLGRTFDQMASELSASYQALEARVSHKKAQLERHNRALQVIHNGSRMLYGGGNDLCASATPMLRELEKVLDIGPVRLSLHNEHDDSDMEILSTHSLHRPRYCRNLECFACLEHAPEASYQTPTDCQAAASSTEQENPNRLVLPLNVGHGILGYLSVNYVSPPNASTRQLLNTLADHLATAIYLQQRIEEQQQLSLIKERTIIARELHDSLAQSLSYLKMQVARLERMQAKGMSVEQQNGVMSDLREGLSSAYRQLRELLSTFRLSLDKPGLQPALQQTVNEFSERLAFPVELTYQVPPHLLSANEEVHLLQIARESLANVLKHANAHWAKVSLIFQQATLYLDVEDDGIGLADDRSPPMHYGLVIMRDRARNINADLTFKNRPEGGTGVHLTFTPQTDRLITDRLINEGSS
jgi:two-component system nitrate/nitrite sensor histidine kinase NarX